MIVVPERLQAPAATGVWAEVLSEDEASSASDNKPDGGPEGVDRLR